MSAVLLLGGRGLPTATYFAYRGLDGEFRPLINEVRQLCHLASTSVQVPCFLALRMVPLIAGTPFNCRSLVTSLSPPSGRSLPP